MSVESLEPQTKPESPWHALEPEQVAEKLQSDPDGLSTAEAESRLESFGPNVLPQGQGDTVFQQIWRQINNPLIFVLLGSAVLAVLMGKVLDGMVVLGVVVLNTLVGFVQEYRANKAVQALREFIPNMTTVYRDGHKTTVPARDLVPGDVVELASGDKVPADMRVLSLRNLRVEESALTGESVPVSKSVTAVDESATLGDRFGMVYGGTMVTYGTAKALVVATAEKTELGKISSLLHDTTSLETPLTQSLEKVAQILTIGILIVSVLFFGIGLWRGFPVSDALLAALALAVAAIPEGLPAIITIALAIGVQRMARRKAVVRKLPAVETLGSTTIICSDKTGTLTRNEMTVRELVTSNRQFHLTGEGFDPSGQLQEHEQTVDDVPQDLTDLLLAGLLCNDATLEKAEERWKIHGDPTEAALVVAARKCGWDTKQLREKHKRIDAIPFESEHQYMATLNQTDDGPTIFVKGAPEVVLSRCNDDSVDADQMIQKVEQLAEHGMRVLAFGTKLHDGEEVTPEDVETGLRFAGLQAMMDPPRQEAIDSIRACHNAGITVKMITGDHEATAKAIGESLGLVGQDHQGSTTGKELAKLDDQKLGDTANERNVFARVAPEHKLKLVKSLQSQRHVVAMTGDGVNDAPALKQANIGVAMGITGTAVSKEAADIVLTDDNFASIAAAVEEGRRVYDNLIKSLAFVLPTNIGEALILLIAVLAFPFTDGVPLLPIQPIQILWINLVATVALALPLAFEAKEPDVMKRRPRDPDAPLLNRFVVIRTVGVAILMTAGSIGLFLYEYYLQVGQGVAVQSALIEAQTMAVTNVVMFQIFYLFNCRSLRASVMDVGLWSNPAVYIGIAVLIALQAGYIYLPFMQVLFDTAPLDGLALLKCLAVAVLVLPVISLEKWWRKGEDVTN